MKLKKFGKLCECQDKCGSYFVFRRGKIKSRIFPMNFVNAEGEQVDSTDVSEVIKNPSKDKTFVNICKLKNREGSYFVVRKDKHHTLIAPLDFIKSPGEEVLTVSLVNVRDYVNSVIEDKIGDSSI